MPDNYLHSIAGWVITAQLGLLAALFGWIGKRIFQRLDELMHSMSQNQKDHSDDMLEIYKAMKAGDDQLHERVTGACNRLSRLEAACEIQHRMSQ